MEGREDIEAEKSANDGGGWKRGDCGSEVQEKEEARKQKTDWGSGLNTVTEKA
jgi:hypothetical protein